MQTSFLSNRRISTLLYRCYATPAFCFNASPLLLCHNSIFKTPLYCCHATTAFSNASVLLPCYNSTFSAHSSCLPLTYGRLPEPSTCAPTTVASTCCNTYLTSACNTLILTYTYYLFLNFCAPSSTHARRATHYNCNASSHTTSVCTQTCTLTRRLPLPTCFFFFWRLAHPTPLHLGHAGHHPQHLLLTHHPPPTSPAISAIHSIGSSWLSIGNQIPSPYHHRPITTAEPSTPMPIIRRHRRTQLQPTDNFTYTASYAAFTQVNQHMQPARNDSSPPYTPMPIIRRQRRTHLEPNGLTTLFTHHHIHASTIYYAPFIRRTHLETNGLTTLFTYTASYAALTERNH
jgi:hypothetical protein